MLGCELRTGLAGQAATGRAGSTTPTTSSTSTKTSRQHSRTFISAVNLPVLLLTAENRRVINHDLRLDVVTPCGPQEEQSTVDAHNGVTAGLFCGRQRRAGVLLPVPPLRVEIDADTEIAPTSCQPETIEGTDLAG